MDSSLHQSSDRRQGRFCSPTVSLGVWRYRIRLYRTFRGNRSEGSVIGAAIVLCYGIIEYQRAGSGGLKSPGTWAPLRHRKVYDSVQKERARPENPDTTTETRIESPKRMVERKRQKSSATDVGSSYRQQGYLPLPVWKTDLDKLVSQNFLPSSTSSLSCLIPNYHIFAAVCVKGTILFYHQLK